MPRPTRTSPDHDALYRIAEQQAGYFTARQAAEAGFSWERLSDYSRKGHFHRVAPRVYRLARFPSSHFEDLFVALLRCGPEALVSHESALAVYGLSDVMPDEIHITVPRTASRRRGGIRLHTNRVSRREVMKREGLPVTSVPRTIADVARAGLAEEHAYHAIKEALQRGLTTERLLLAEGNRRGGQAARVIRNCLAHTR
jgi:predicted transcriptional regulator of viral defense system